jgi:hypothetical protein
LYYLKKQSTMGKRQAAISNGGKKKRSKKAATVPVVPVPVAVSAVAVAAAAVIPPRVLLIGRKGIKKVLFDILKFPSPVASSAVATAAFAVPVIPVPVIGTVNRTSDIRKLLGSEHKLVVSSVQDQEGILKFADNVVNLILTKNCTYNLRRCPTSLSQAWYQMRSSLMSLDIDAYYENCTVRTLIHSTNSLPNLKSLTMRQPLFNIANRRRYLGIGWTTLSQTCYDDDNVCVKTNPNLKRISIKPGVWSVKKELDNLKEFVETNPSIEYMDVIHHEDYEDRYRTRRYDSDKRTKEISQAEDIVKSAVNTLAKNRALSVETTAMEGGVIASFKLEEIFATHCYINVFDRTPGAPLYPRAYGGFLDAPPDPFRKADSMTPLFDVIKYLVGGPTRNSRKCTGGDDAVNQATIFANVDEANFNEANVNESTVLTDDTILANVADFKASYGIK